MDDFKRVKEDSESNYSDNDLTSQMREKIRNQAQRLRALEQYRILCEHRIQELHPGHPIPIKPEHLGSMADQSAELLQAKQKISRLESLLSEKQEYSSPTISDPDLHEKFSILTKDKNELEESLRAEMLTCEEQRTYIEVLKQALESKSEHSRAESEVQPKAKKPEENRREQTKAKNTLLDYESQIKRLQGLLKAKETEIANLTEEKSQLEGHLGQAAEALQIAEEEVDKLEEEKTNLLEYVDEHSLKEQEMEKELNDLSKYFDSMKTDLDNSKKALEESNKRKNQVEVKSEVLQEEVYRANQMVKELQSTLNEYRVGTDDREMILRRMKEEKLALEIKVENLQANCETLEDTLKNTQEELDNEKRLFEQFKFGESDKTENLGKMKVEVINLNAEKESLVGLVNELKRQLEEEKRDHQEIERMREMDIAQIQDFKQNLIKYKARCEALEDANKQQSEAEQFRALDEQKIAQLQEDFNYLQELYRDTQQRELAKAETLNELRKHNTELSKELEELYRENEKLSADFGKKKLDLENFHRKFEHASQVCESLENDKKVLEMHLRGEKNTVKSFKDQNMADRAKLEEYSKQLSYLQDSYESLSKKFKNQENEISSLKSKLKLKDRENEEDKYKHTKMSEELQIMIEKVKIAEMETETMQGEIVECCKIVAAFAGKYTVSGHDFRSHISQGYREFLVSWKDKISSSPKILFTWVQSTVKEIEQLARLVQDSSKEAALQMAEAKKMAFKLEGINTEDYSQRQEQQRLKSQLDSMVKKHEAFVQNSEKETSSLKQELFNCKKEASCLLAELNSVKDLMKQVQLDNNELKLNSELVKSTLRTQEDRVNLLKTEKIQLEGLLAQIQRSVGNSEISKIYNEIGRIRGELEVVEREKLNLECQMVKYESDPRAKDSEGYRELSQKLGKCEREIRNFKKTMHSCLLYKN